jgi:hypothetical protein
MPKYSNTDLYLIGCSILWFDSVERVDNSKRINRDKLPDPQYTIFREK